MRKDRPLPPRAKVLARVEWVNYHQRASAGIHRSTVHNWTRHHPDFARALLNGRHSRAERILDELGDLADLAIDTFRQLLSDENAPASVRLKAAMENAPESAVRLLGEGADFVVRKAVHAFEFVLVVEESVAGADPEGTIRARPAR